MRGRRIRPPRIGPGLPGEFLVAWVRGVASKYNVVCTRDETLALDQGWTTARRSRELPLNLPPRIRFAFAREPDPRLRTPRLVIWMRVGSCLLFATLFPGVALLALPSHLISQDSGSGPIVSAAKELPEAPRPQLAVAATETPDQQTSAQPAPSSTPAQTPAVQGSSSSQPAAQQPAEKSQHEKAEEQLKEQEQQRVVGVVPTFNVTYRPDTVSLTAAQKIKLALHTAVDPFTLAEGPLIGAYHEVINDDPGFPWGFKGYAERSGAAYLDSFDGAVIGNGLLPALLHQDPRYFRLGHGTTTHRLLYALATNVVARHDNTGKWQPNYSNVGGNILSGALSNLYYPAASRNGVGLTISNGLIQTGTGGAGSVFEEFWPDISRRFLHKDPTQGRDAKARALDAEEKKAAKEAKAKAKKQQQNPR